MDKLQKLIDHLESMKEDNSKFYLKKNDAAGVRLRQGFIQAINMCKESRVNIQEKRK